LAIAYLVEHPNDISLAWGVAGQIRHLGRNVLLQEIEQQLVPVSCLFGFCTRRAPRYGCPVGCLTMVKVGDTYCVDGPLDLTRAVQADPRIPTGIHSEDFVKLTQEERRAFLQPFAEWQRRFDTELPRSADYRTPMEILLQAQAQAAN
jgi:hypothetical protein